MAIINDMRAWIENAERARDNKFGAPAELMRESINEIEALVDMLKEAALQLEYLAEKFTQTSTGVAVVARINAAIAKVGGT